MSYCRNSLLTINFKKTKLMVFSRHSKVKDWVIEGQHIEQVKTFKYLGTVFSRTLSWSYHRQAAVQVANNTAKYPYVQGGQFIPAALQIVKYKILAQLPYGITIWINGFNPSVESVLSNLL